MWLQRGMIVTESSSGNLQALFEVTRRQFHLLGFQGQFSQIVKGDSQRRMIRRELRFPDLQCPEQSCEGQFPLLPVHVESRQVIQGDCNRRVIASVQIFLQLEGTNQ